jgi:2-dehydropantoate 2-reductase
MRHASAVRYVVIGAGAVGGVIGARLAAVGREVTLVARGAHLAALQAVGLRVDSPNGTELAPLPAVAGPGDIAWGDGDVAVLAVKSQDTHAALDALAAAAPMATVVCAQNGVRNEEAALRRFPSVVAMCVLLPGAHLAPGVVRLHSTTVPGILDVGAFPSGDAGWFAEDLRRAGFESVARPDIMRWKYAKLVLSLANAVDACCAPSDARDELARLACDEGRGCLDAAGIDYVSAADEQARRGTHITLAPVNDAPRGGGSTWQSLVRGLPLETDYLNGEIVLLGRLHGVPTPVNALLQRTATEHAHHRRPPGILDAADLLARLS